MTGSLIVTPEVLEQAEAIVRACTVPREYAPALLDEVARALQLEVNRAELADMERTQAVATMRRLCERLKELHDTAVIEAWVTCPRCGERGPSPETLEHDERCVLSLRPPPRLSLVSPKANEDDAS